MLKVRKKFNKELALSVAEYSLMKNLLLPKEKVILSFPWPKNEKIIKLIVDDFY